MEEREDGKEMEEEGNGEKEGSEKAWDSPHLEEVPDWHGGMGEAMDEEGLENPFGVVEGPAHHSNPEWQG